MQPLQNKPFQAGFSLLELLTTLSILAIVTTLAIPHFALFYQQQQMALEAKNLYHTLQFAKSLAIKNNHLIGVCGTFDFTECHENWSKGYLVFKIDQKGPITSEQILRKQKRETSFLVHSKKRKVFTFQGDGQCLTRGSIYIGEGEDNGKKRVIIPDSGRIRIEDIV